MRRRELLPLGALLVPGLVLGCAHATQTRAQERGAAEAAQAPARAETIATSKTTKHLFKPDGLKKLQGALDEHVRRRDSSTQAASDQPLKRDEGPRVAETRKGGRVQSVPTTGRLDARTQLALQQFQRSEGLPETGLPDYETLRRLGLEPDDIYQPGVPAERLGVD